MNKTIQHVLLLAMTASLALLVPSPAMAYEPTPYGAIVALAVYAAYFFFCALRKREANEKAASSAGSVSSGAIAIIGRVPAVQLALWVIPASLIGARLLYCLVRFGFYFLEMGPMSVLRVWEGGFLLYGAVFGAMAAAACLARHKHVSIAETLDELAAPGLLAAAVSRLGEWVTGEGVGTWMENEVWMRFPFAVMNEYEEWQLAVFLFEAAAALVLLIPVLREKVGRGRRIETALLLFACCQIVFESLRMDSCLKIGFVRVSQVISAVVILAVTMLRAGRHGGKKEMMKRLLILIMSVAIVGGLEWALDKTPVNNVVLYLVMIAVCSVMMINGGCFSKSAAEKQ